MNISCVSTSSHLCGAQGGDVQRFAIVGWCCAGCIAVQRLLVSTSAGGGGHSESHCQRAFKQVGEDDGLVSPCVSTFLFTGILPQNPSKQSYTFRTKENK